MKTETENLRELDDEMHLICGWSYDLSRHAWQRNGYWCEESNHYTEGEQFQELLEKCIRKDRIEIDFDGESFFILHSNAKTLPLALCRFAKLLFSK